MQPNSRFTGNARGSQISYRFPDLQWRRLRMRNILLRVLFLFIATAIFVSPLIAMADDFCRCPDCARQTCLVKSEHCPGRYCSQEAGPCCGRDAAAESDPAEPNHKSQEKSKDCHCSTLICYDGNAIMPVSSSILSSTADEFYQRIPKAFITSGWVHQILRPPR